MHPYEMTALEDPAEIGSDLPQGGGRIQQPNGDIRSFQFEIPAGSDSAAARRQGALQDMQFQIQKRNAEEAAMDEQSRIDMLATVQEQYIQKALEAGERYKSLRNYKRDIDDAMATGLDKEQATIWSSMRNPGALGGGSGAAAVINAIRPPRMPTEHTTRSGQTVFFGGERGES